MRSWLVAVGALAAAAAPAAGQGVEWQAHALTALAETDFAGGGVGAGFRAATRLRVGTTLSAGILDGAAAGRGEVLATFLLNPLRRRHGVLVYGGGGAAVTFTGDTAVERLVLLVGVERAPASGPGWFVEGGVGGGVRVAAGVRLRRAGRRGR